MLQLNQLLIQFYHKIIIKYIYLLLFLHENKDIVYFLVKRLTSYDLENGLIYNNGMVKIKIILNNTIFYLIKPLYIEKDFLFSKYFLLFRSIGSIYIIC